MSLTPTTLVDSDLGRRLRAVPAPRPVLNRDREAQLTDRQREVFDGLGEGRIIDDVEIKEQMSRRNPYRQWLKDSMVNLADVPEPANVTGTDFASLITRQQLFGYTLEDLRILMSPMASTAKEANFSTSGIGC